MSPLAARRGRAGSPRPPRRAAAPPHVWDLALWGVRVGGGAGCREQGAPLRQNNQLRIQNNCAVHSIVHCVTRQIRAVVCRRKKRPAHPATVNGTRRRETRAERRGEAGQRRSAVCLVFHYCTHIAASRGTSTRAHTGRASSVSRGLALAGSLAAAARQGGRPAASSSPPSSSAAL